MADKKEPRQRRISAAQAAARKKASERRWREEEAAAKKKIEEDRKREATAEKSERGVAGADRTLNEQRQTPLQEALVKLSRGEKPTTFSPMVKAETPPVAAEKAKRPLADPAIYGKPQVQRLREARQASEALRVKRLQKDGKALVYMGDIIAPKVRDSRYGKEGDFAQTESDAKAAEGQSLGDNIVEAQNLAGWLYDPKRYDDIVKRARAAGVEVDGEDFEAVEKLWSDALRRAATAYAAGQKVTPWAIFGLLGRAKKDGTDGPSTRLTTDVAIEEMDPATARRMVQTAAREFLGKDPSEAQIDDFIARAQLVAKQNPRITKTTSQLDAEGVITDQTSSTTGGGQAVTDQALLEAEEMMKADPEYGEIQASTFYFNALQDAIGSTVG